MWRTTTAFSVNAMIYATAKVDLPRVADNGIFGCSVILNLMAFCFGAIPDIMIELIVYGSVPQIITGPLVIGKNNV